MNPPSRTATTAAVGFLALDALLLVYGGVELHRPWLVLAGAACGLGAALVLLAWRRHRRTLAELEVARREMKREVDEIRQLLKSDQRIGG